MTTRRLFLKGAASASAAVAAASAGLVAPAAPALPEGVAGEFVAAEIKTFEAHPYRWWFSPYTSGEYFTDECSSKEEAERLLEEYGGGLVAECQQQDFDMRLDGETIFEALYGQNEDRMSEDGDFIDATNEQLSDLAVMVNAAIAAWVQKHKIDTTAWLFGDVRNQVVMKKTETREGSVAKD